MGPGRNSRLDNLPVAVRALPQSKTKEKPRPAKEKIRWPKMILVLDTETTVDPTQRLNFGSYWWGNPETLETVIEGLFYGDDLPKRDPKKFECLKEYTAAPTHSVITGREIGEMKLGSRREFVDKVFFPAAYKSRALIVDLICPLISPVWRTIQAWHAANSSAVVSLLRFGTIRVSAVDSKSICIDLESVSNTSTPKSRLPVSESPR